MLSHYYAETEKKNQMVFKYIEIETRIVITIGGADRRK